MSDRRARPHVASPHAGVALGSQIALPILAEASVRADDIPARSQSWLSCAVAHLRLARPTDNAFAFIGTVLGAGLVGSSAPTLLVIQVAVSNALLSAASMLVNDWHDVAEDAVNRPERPIPSGAVPRRRALGMGIVALVAGNGVAAAAGWPFGLAALGVTGLSVLYTVRLKSIPFVGNAAIGLLSAYPLWCWIMLEGLHDRVYLGAAAGFFIAGVGREIVRTAADARGDRARGLRTVATVWRPTVANQLGVLLILAGYLGGWLAAFGSSLIWYVASLTLATAVMVTAGTYYIQAAPPRLASSRVTTIARVLTALLALGVSVDLAEGVWGLL